MLSRIFLVFSILLGLTLTLSAEESFTKLGFDTRRDLFTAGSGAISLRAGAMIWTYKHGQQQHMACYKALGRGGLKGMRELQFEAVSSAPFELWVQLQERSGESYYALVPVKTKKASCRLAVSDFRLLPETKKDGRLALSQVKKIILVDGQPGQGNTSLRLSDMGFSTGQTASNTSSPQTKTRPRTHKFKTKLGLAAIPKSWQETDENWDDVFKRARSLGLRHLSVGLGNWSETEISPGNYNWSAHRKLYKAMAKHGRFEISLDFPGPFYHRKITAPSHVPFRRFAEQEFLAAYLAMVDSYLDEFGRKIDYFVVHAEGAFNYFQANPSQAEDYFAFLTAVRQHIQKRNPRLRVGINTDPRVSDELLAGFAKSLDYVGFDVLKDEALESPDQLEAVLARILIATGDTPIAVQNGGWTSYAEGGSSESEQVEFVREFYRLMKRHKKRVLYANFYLLYDDDLEMMRPVYQASFPDLPADFVERMVVELGAMGVLRADGTPKPAWQELRRQIRSF